MQDLGQVLSLVNFRRTDRSTEGALSRTLLLKEASLSEKLTERLI